MCVYIYIYIYTYLCIYICVAVYTNTYTHIYFFFFNKGIKLYHARCFVASCIVSTFSFCFTFLLLMQYFFGALSSKCYFSRTWLQTGDRLTTLMLTPARPQVQSGWIRPGCPIVSTGPRVSHNLWHMAEVGVRANMVMPVAAPSKLALLDLEASSRNPALRYKYGTPR